jgi:aldehyde dehydrogenase (NAD+)
MVPTDDRAARLRSGLLIGGEWHDEGSGGTLDHVNPSTGKVQATFALAGTAEVDAAVGAARTALAEWRRMPAVARRAVLNRIGELIREHADEFATINALEVGTPAALSRARYTSGITAFEYHAGWVDRLSGDTIPMAPGQTFDFTLLEPIGVVAANPHVEPSARQRPDGGGARARRRMCRRDQATRGGAVRLPAVRAVVRGGGRAAGSGEHRAGRPRSG